MNDIKTQEALFNLSQQATPIDAIKFYKDNYEILKHWRYIYASDNNQGTFKLKNTIIDETVGIQSIYKGNSLFIIDSNMIGHNNTVPYLCGLGTYFDSNTASYIYSLAYKNHHTEQLKKRLKQIQDLKIDYSNVNPYFYLYEAQRHYQSNPETIEYSKKTFAAINALKKINVPLNEEWSRIYQTYFREQSELEIEPIFNGFLNNLKNGFSEAINFQCALIELLLTQTKILEISSRTSPENKLEQLFHFMDNDLEILMIRELACCADILFHDNFSSLTQKLNGLHQKQDPIKFIQNCAWDLFIFRLMDDLSNAYTGPKKPDFYISHLVACDRDIWGIAKLSSLKGIALHTKSSLVIPFMEHDPQQWLEQKIGSKKLAKLYHCFSPESRERRLGWMHSNNKDSEFQHKMEKIFDLADKKRKELLDHLSK
ncbi:hypothetical protein [Gilliamella sp. Pas-s25]|uniref:hypothetical protein n=1 Tax=Gilliamella sp. Pas-s25 TaxID=2687310 RepID=UPI00135ED35B|nr:hypothetical protein [Gilliamella sp. Pas-s25]MWP62256.1 hypothetical protein [Gilliamella sp. Pas-s25]